MKLVQKYFQQIYVTCHIRFNGRQNWPVHYLKENMGMKDQSSLKCFCLLLHCLPKVYTAFTLSHISLILLYTFVSCLFLYFKNNLCCAKDFKFNQVPLVYFCFYLQYSGRWVIDDPAVIYVRRVFCLCSPLGVLQFLVLHLDL